MSNNTYQHVSNESRYVKFDPTGTNFPAEITDVQAAIAAISPAGVNGVPDASSTTKGILFLATEQEVIDGTDNTKAVTPATLATRLSYPNATETVYGLTRYSTNDEAIAGVNNESSITPAKFTVALNNAFETRVSTESSNGVIKISSLPQALAGADDTTAMTPLKTQQLAIKLIAQIAPSETTATESDQGVVQLATVAQVRQGTLREGYAISPYTLMNSTATEEYKGVIKLGTQSEVNSNNASVAVTGATLNGRGSTTSMRGVVKLTTTAGSQSGGDASSALAWNADVIHQRGGQTINGTLRINNTLTIASGGANITGTVNMTGGYIQGKRVVTQNEIDRTIPVGAIMMWAADSLPSDAWRFCHGGTVSASDCPLYASRIGTRYGGSSSNPGLPDMRGLFVRGSGRGSHLTNPNVNGNDQFGKPRLGVGCTGGYVGEVQKQQMSYHKHAGGFGEYDDSGAFGNTRRSNFVGTRKGLDWDNRSYFTNDGYEIDPASQRNSKYTLNRPELIGNETRPWNISLNYIIKVKE